MTRTFTASKAVRKSVPLLVGLYSPSGGGKTRSALRLATGMQRVTGGKIVVIDTEAGRALAHADDFDFIHVPMGEPFGSLDYLEVIKFAKAKGEGGPVIVDQMSYEHEGVGGMLSLFNQLFAAKNFADNWRWACWAKAKEPRQTLIQGVRTMGVNAIFTFRAKPKMKIKKGEDPVSKGYQPIAGDEFLFEMTLNALFYPNADGVPNWAPDEPGESLFLKLPGHFREMFKDSRSMDEEHGEAMAKWAAGDVAPQAREEKPDRASEERESGEPVVGEVLFEVDRCDTNDQLFVLAAQYRDFPWTENEKATIKKAMDARSGELVKR